MADLGTKMESKSWRITNRKPAKKPYKQQQGSGSQSLLLPRYLKGDARSFKVASRANNQGQMMTKTIAYNHLLVDYTEKEPRVMYVLVIMLSFCQFFYSFCGHLNL